MDEAAVLAMPDGFATAMLGMQLYASISTGPFVGVSLSSAFCASHGVNDDAAQSDLAIGVAQFQNSPTVWRDLYDAWILKTKFGATNHVSLMGNSYNTTYDVYDDFGEQFGSTNFVTAALPNLGSNYTMVVYYRELAPEADAYIGSVIANENMAELVSTNDGSSTMLMTWQNFYGQRLFSSANTNFSWGPNTINNGAFTNKIATMLSGEFRSGNGCLIPAAVTRVVAVSVNTNLFTVYVDGKVAGYGNTGPFTNVLVQRPPTAPLNQLRLGGGDLNFIKYSVAGSNVIGGMSIAAVELFTNSIELSTNILASSYAFMHCLDDGDTAVSFQGSSIIANENDGDEITQPGNSGVKPYTNDIALLYKQMNPRTTVIQEGAAGSQLAWYTSENGGWSNNIPFSTAALLDLPLAKFKHRIVITDAPRNDVPIPGPINGSQISTIVQNFTNFYSKYTSQGCEVRFIQTPFVQNFTGATPPVFQSLATNNNAFVSVYDAIYTNFPINQVYPMDKYVTLEYLQTVSADSPPCHLSLMTAQGYMANKAVAMLCSSGRWPLNFTGYSTNFPTTGTLWPFTNVFPYTVQGRIWGGTVTGIAVGTNTVCTSSAAGQLIQVPIQPGMVMWVTNSSAPNFNYDSTQIP